MSKRKLLVTVDCEEKECGSGPSLPEGGSMSDYTTGPYPVCSYCGSMHRYSAEMCKDIHAHWPSDIPFPAPAPDPRDDLIRSLRLDNGRLREALADALWRWEQADANNPQIRVDEVALTTPGPLWSEVKWLLENAQPETKFVKQSSSEWHRRRDAVLGGKA